MSLATGHALGRRVNPDDLLEVTCWCESSVVRLTPTEVFNGVTQACRRRECRIMAVTAGAVA